jgi:hypothetical protein
MNGRVRFLAALLALVGFTALFAESLVAMSCMPGTTVGGIAVATHDGMHDPAPSPESESKTQMPQHCPLPMAGNICAAPATLPAATWEARDPASVRDPAIVAVVDAASELLSRTLFHPPRT